MIEIEVDEDGLTVTKDVSHHYQWEVETSNTERMLVARTQVLGVRDRCIYYVPVVDFTDEGVLTDAAA